MTRSMSANTPARVAATDSLGWSVDASTRTARAAPTASASRRTASAPAGPTVATVTSADQRSARTRAHSRAARSASEQPVLWPSSCTAPLNGSTSGCRSTHFRATPICERATTASAPVVDDALAAVGVGPFDGALGVAHQVAGAALEALLVVEEDAPVAGGHEEVGRARGDAGLGRATATRVTVDGDVGSGADAELDGRHAVFEADVGPV